MTIAQQIDEDLKTAQKEKNEVAVSSLRNLKAALKNAEIEKGKPLADEDILAVSAKKVKQHKDSIESFTAGARADLAQHEQAQMKVLQKYLPKQMDETELSSIVKNVVMGMNATPADFGKVMKEVMAKVKGQADGGMISKIVKENLK
ncbi:MAG: GatB/YqeY domain-containing protein [Candidatus Doudnabacteria bacterium]